MALTIRNQEVERLAEEVARLAGETKTEAVRKALEMRLRELQRKRSFGRVIRSWRRRSGPRSHRSFWGRESLKRRWTNFGRTKW